MRGAAHILQAGPVYLLMPSQQFLQIGAQEILSVVFLHKGQVEGKIPESSEEANLDRCNNTFGSELVSEHDKLIPALAC